MRALLASAPATGPAVATSAWSIISWVFFGLAALAAVGIGVWWAALRPAAADPHVGPVADVFTLLGMGTAWGLALVFASLGTLSGLIGIVSPAGRTGTAWAAIALNGALLAVGLGVLHILSP